MNEFLFQVTTGPQKSVLALRGVQRKGSSAVLAPVASHHHGLTEVGGRRAETDNSVAGCSFEAEARKLIGAWRRHAVRKLGVRR